MSSFYGLKKILKNDSFGGPTYFDGQWATCLGSRQEGRTEAGQVAGEKGGLPSVKVAPIHVVLRYHFWMSQILNLMLLSTAVFDIERCSWQLDV